MGILGKLANAAVNSAKEELVLNEQALEKARALDDETLLKRIRSRSGTSRQLRAYMVEAKNRGIRP